MDKKTLREAQMHISEARSFVEAVRDDEQEKYEEKSDQWKDSEKGSDAEERINQLSEAIDNLEISDTCVENAMKD